MRKLDVQKIMQGLKKMSGLLMALLFFLLPLEAEAAISFVSSTCENSRDGNGDMTLTLPTTLENDLVIIAYAIGDAYGINFNMDASGALSGAGFTEIADTTVNSADANEIDLGVYYKIMTATPDTSVTIDGQGGNDASVVAVCIAFRGVDTTTPLDVTTTSTQGVDTMYPNPPSINHNNPAGVWTVIAGASGHNTNSNTVTYTFPTGYTTNAINRAHIDTSDAAVGMGYRESGVSDPEDPGVMTLSGTDSANYSWAAATIALRPASVPTATTNFANAGFNSATLHGTKSGGGNATEHGFAYGTDSTLATVIATTTLGALASNSSFFSYVSGLSASITYYFRAYATNNGGTGYGVIKSFVTGDSTTRRKMRLFEGFKIKFLNGTIILHQE